MLFSTYQTFQPYMCACACCACSPLQLGDVFFAESVPVQVKGATVKVSTAPLLVCCCS